jgi:hypothetical protein
MGATVNVLPYQVGCMLGAVWDDRPATMQLGGNLAPFPARPLVVSAIVGGFTPVRLAFAWTKAQEIPLILGQVNFFMQFDVCFYHRQRAFEVHPRRQTKQA